MTFGVGPYGIGTLGVPSLTPVPEVLADLSSSRKIDGKTKKYVIDGNGGFSHMDDIHQRILLLIAFNVTEPEFLDNSFPHTMEQQIRNALKPLTDGTEPEIGITLIQITTDRDSSDRYVRFKKFATNTDEVVHF